MSRYLGKIRARLARAFFALIAVIIFAAETNMVSGKHDVLLVRVWLGRCRKPFAPVMLVVRIAALAHLTL